MTCALTFRRSLLPSCSSRSPPQVQATSITLINPQQFDEGSMFARSRFFVRQDIEQKPQRSHVERDEGEAPLHHYGLRVILILVPRHIGGRGCGERKPDDEQIVDQLDQHCRESFTAALRLS